MIAVKLLDICFRTDENKTKKLLTYELDEWSGQTVINLAVGAKHKDFIAHPCCQFLLNDMWYGPLQMRRFQTIRVSCFVYVFSPSVKYSEIK